ncbi:glycerol 3-phosphate dehydrogenase (NAD(P)+) [Halobacillus karajensis]|uniref:Glycerol-3-phosphate dehydrogenase [NAD(P)+] n=1 Tax=Halobacillus karajensis TaxID=195088 RepID=A0A024P1F1_9BACI|nr:NAD(P)H-dependent glycerol-3-phosphate dehydrogenase [Halobacillus karajensis]CDQ19488.1 Glycerol-3-phosphate dehydrogenase [NAD(P)+] [Halobacillus karajensis]CDQ21950.1 Glycerol-3-phosphate dehydrogenase [NAD(P)+] [Halobacillus karajensis]CDQ27791.1 Glycerol-3-phosphate dehydrogenase [NAD(P)+] [Halobacillus karajensis]SEH81576.1 glycerol 3-phosphate dehydrogenase (NAD(P)+) [Halobacillus karajensis]
MEKVAVLGAGSWGTALALVLADNGHNVHLWTHRENLAEEINRAHTNEKYLKDVKLPTSIQANHDLKTVVEDAGHVVLVVPTKAMREVCAQLKQVLNQKVIITHASKGIEPGTYKRVSEVMREEIPSNLYEDIVVLSGPSHAEEVSLRQPTTVTVSSEKLEVAEEVQDLFINRQFRVYTSPDLVGVELGGALKNIIALGAGISDGLGYGDNAKAALITRGLAEIARLGTSMGANPLTFSGLTGIGDLIVTCTSSHSRNWRAGNKLGKGHPLEDVLEQMGMVVEGVRTTKAAFQLAQDQGVEMPITSGIYRILFEAAEPRDVVDELMTRIRRHEMEDLTNILDEKMND